MIAYYIGGYLLMVAIFCGILGGRAAFDVFMYAGVIFLVIGFVWDMVMS